jgi:HAMP domain-containing protein
MPEMLRATGLEKWVTVLPLAPAAGGEALVKREIDCACMLTVAEDPVVKKLLADEGVRLMSFRRADAYVATFPFLNKVTVPQGVASLEKNRPPEDVTLVAPMASLLVRRDLHPALQYLLLQAAEDIHSGAGVLSRLGQFPAAERGDVPLSREAHNYYKSGGSFIQRNLPFWLAVFVSRLLFVLVPLLGVLYPLLRVLPLVLSFAFERRVNALYAELRRIDARIGAGDPAGEISQDLARLDEQIERTRVSASRARELYALRHHASLVRDRLLAARPSAAPAS